jgi:hypothetical protein
VVEVLALDNKTPFSAERTIVMDKSGEKSWVVVVKATFDVDERGKTELSPEQKPPLFSAEHIAEPGSSSIRYEAEMLPSKGATDVILNAKAYAPKGKPAEFVDVGMAVGPLKKYLRVFGDRVWTMGVVGQPTFSAPAKFEQKPIIFERAFGGWDRTDPDPQRQQMYWPNPIGSGFATRASNLEGQPLPNVEVPTQLISTWKDRPPPGGFGAIASYWSPRIECGGTYDATWQKSKFPLLPDDFDSRFYRCALPDQQVVGYLRGGEDVALLNLTQSGSLRFSLPKVFLAFTTRFGKHKEEHRATLQTVIIEPDYPRVIMVWHTTLACHHRLDDLDRTIIRQKRYV